MLIRLMALVGAAVCGCGGAQYCARPGDHETRPAEKVELPPVELAGFALGVDEAAVAATCTAHGGVVATRGPATMLSCAGRDGYVRIDFDPWGRAIAVSVEGTAITREEAGAAIDRALGGDGTFVGQTDWSWRGGQVFLTIDPLRLRYDNDEMHERTTYGLPSCGA
jgi:hypothetical protein